nr:MAG TPA_asm: hypothetical protein [Caudoviricetes sp.]
MCKQKAIAFECNPLPSNTTASLRSSRFSPTQTTHTNQLPFIYFSMLYHSRDGRLYLDNPQRKL